MWCHRSRVHSIPHIAFPISGQLILSLYLSPFSYIYVTTLAFWGHVTSSVMWPMDSTVAISYRCSIVTKCVSPAVFEIFGSKVPGQGKSSLRMRDTTCPVPLCKIWVHILISRPYIAHSLTLIGLRWTDTYGDKGAALQDLHYPSPALWMWNMDRY